MARLKTPGLKQV